MSVTIQEVLLPYYWWQNRILVNIKNKFSYPTTAGAYCWLSLDVDTKINLYVKMLIEGSLALYCVNKMSFTSAFLIDVLFCIVLFFM